MEENEEETEEWMHIHRTLLAIAERRADLDAKEAFWLREAIAREIWQPLGMVSIYDYMERVLEHRPQTARERLGVAEALGELPQLAHALATGQLRYSAVKELTRVASPETEGDWLEAAAGKPVRADEKLVRGHHRGDRPTDPVDPDCGPHELRFEVSADVYALLRQARHVLDERAGRRLDDDELVATLANAALDGQAATDEVGGASARYQIGLTVCERCGQGAQIGAGVEVPVNAATVERAHCDAQHIGRIDAQVPERAYRDVSPAVARLVHHRDHGCCRNPGCRSSLGIEIHHIVARAQGGSHVPSNLVLLCFSCHRSHHEGLLRIHGTADELVVDRVDILARTGDIELPRSALAVAGVGGAVNHADRSAATEPVHSHVGAMRATAAADSSGSTEPVHSHVGARTTPAADLHSSVATGPAHSHVGAARRVTIDRAATDPGPEAPSPIDRAILRSQARDALAALGWRRDIVARAVDTALQRLPATVPLQRALVEALRQCPTR